MADTADDETDSETYDRSDWADDYPLAARGESAPNDEDTPTSERKSEQEQESETDQSREEKQEDTPTDDPDEKPRATVEFTPGNEDTEDTSENEPQSNGEVDQPALTAIQYVGEERAEDLRTEGFESVDEIAAADQSALAEVEGIGDARATTIAESANELIEEQPDGAVAAADD